MATESFTRRIELDKRASETLRAKLERGAEHVWKCYENSRKSNIKIVPVTSQETIDKIVEKH